LAQSLGEQLSLLLCRQQLKLPRRYANRIKNGTFTIDGVKSHIPNNEHGGLNPLHGGTVGYDQRNWTVVSHTSDSITFSFLDKAYEGFPGSVMTYATYTLSDSKWTSSLVSIALDKPTPIMLANHVYWNLDAFTSGPSSTVLNHTLWMPYSKRRIDADPILIPTGEILTTKGTPFDFTTPKQIGKDIANAKACGYGCVGYDNAFILDRPRYSAPEARDLTVLTLSSPKTGITMDVRTNQQSLQIYSCVGQNGTIPVKQSQQHGGAEKTFVNKYGCLVIETQQWIDGINNPQWGQSEYQIYTPESGPAVVWAEYEFGTTG
jgi:aldose 1-epimerase